MIHDLTCSSADLDSWCAVDPLPSTSIMNVLHLDLIYFFYFLNFGIFFMFAGFAIYSKMTSKCDLNNSFQI
jgi:hypothetical protein